MEHFGARDEEPKHECVQLIREQAGSFVGIYAHRYGYTPPDCDRSITEMEFDAATLAGLQRFIYIVDEEAPWKPGLIDTGDSGERLTRFKERMRTGLIVKRFSSKDQLAGYVAADLGRYLATRELRRVDSAPPSGEERLSRAQVSSVEEWIHHRDTVYSATQGYFLAHTLSPSKIPNQLFDIFIYLRKHKSQNTPEVNYAEFFLGRHWGSRIFKVENQGGLVGVSTSAYGEFLCVCRVTLRDGTQIMLERYVDFGTITPPEPRKIKAVSNR